MSDDIIVPRHHYDALINAASQLVTVANNAVETILSETPYESMLRGPAEALNDALKNVPGADKWDGSWSEDDVEYESFRHHSQPERSGPSVGVKATHRPTGLSVESYMKPSADANQASALRSLKGRVERYVAEHGTS